MEDKVIWWAVGSCSTKVKNVSRQCVSVDVLDFAKIVWGRTRLDRESVTLKVVKKIVCVGNRV